MSPELGYGLLLGLGGIATLAVKRWHERRLGFRKRHPNYRFLWGICLLGAVIGAKVGMLLYLPIERMPELAERTLELDFGGKTILGALTGGYLFGEIGKKLLGVRFSTGDALALALPIGQAIGRVGCVIGGCCYGSVSSVPWAIAVDGVMRHPVQLYETGLDLTLAAVLFAISDRPRPAGHLFRYYLIGYCAIRFSLDLFRGEPQPMLGPFSYAQVYCAIAAVILVSSVVIGRRRATATATA